MATNETYTPFVVSCEPVEQSNHQLYPINLNELLPDPDQPRKYMDMTASTDEGRESFRVTLTEIAERCAGMTVSPSFFRGQNFWSVANSLIRS